MAEPDLQIKLRGGDGGNHPDPEISGGRAGLGNKFFFGPSGLSLVQK